MAANMRTADSAMLVAQEKVMAWWPKFVQQWQGGYSKVPVAIALQKQPQEVKDQLQQMNPEAYDRVMKRYGGQNGGN